MTTTPRLLAAAAAALLALPATAQFRPPPADYPFAQEPAARAWVHWMDRVQYQAIDGAWRDGSLRVESGRVLLYRDRGSRWPLADLKGGTLVDADWRSKRRWKRVVIAAAAAAGGTWAAWRLTPRKPVLRPCPEPAPEAEAPPCTPGATESGRHWPWASALAAGGALTWAAWRNQATRSMIVLSAPEGQVRLRTAPRSRHEALATRLRRALEEDASLIRPAATAPEGALHPHYGDWTDPRSRPAGTQWLR